MICVRIVGPNSDGISAWSARAEDCCIIGTQDERIVARICQVQALRCGLVDIITARGDPH